MNDACKTYVPVAGCLLPISALGAGALSVDAGCAGTAMRGKRSLAWNA